MCWACNLLVRHLIFCGSSYHHNNISGSYYHSNISGLIQHGIISRSYHHKIFISYITITISLFQFTIIIFVAFNNISISYHHDNISVSYHPKEIILSYSFLLQFINCLSLWLYILSQVKSSICLCSGEFLFRKEEKKIALVCSHSEQNEATFWKKAHSSAQKPKLKKVTFFPPTFKSQEIRVLVNFHNMFHKQRYGQFWFQESCLQQLELLKNFV